MDPLLFEKLSAEAEDGRRFDRLARDCRRESDPDTLRLAVSRMEAIFNDHFTHEHFSADDRAFEKCLTELRRSVDQLGP